MASAVALRSKLCSLLDNYKKLKHESALVEEELSRRIAEKHKAEDTRIAKFSEMMAKEKKLEELHEKINEADEKYAELEKSSLECRRTTEILMGKIKVQDDTIENLQNRADEAKTQAIESAQVYSKTLTKLRELQNSSERLEKREEHLQKISIELHSEKVAVNNSLQKSELKNDQIRERVAKLEQAIQTFNERLESANKRAIEAESVYESLSLELAMLDEEANDWAEKSHILAKQVDELKLSMQSA